MPEIIDNVKMGLFIKELLKEKAMTQEQLAQYLAITKSAVSQNLNGHSTFDIQNLMRIAELFEMTLDELIHMERIKKTPPESGSEYEKVLQKGLAELQKINKQDLHITEPDTYGKVFMDYVVQHQNLEVCQYLLSLKIPFVKDTYHRAKGVYLNVIQFVLEKGVTNIVPLIEKYTELHGAFIIEEKAQAKTIWTLLSGEPYKALVNQLFTHKITQTVESLKVLSIQRKVPLLTKAQWLHTFAEHQITPIYQAYLETQLTLADYKVVFPIFIEHHYDEGIHLFMDSKMAAPTPLTGDDLFPMQTMVGSLITQGNLSLVQRLLEKRCWWDMTALAILALKQKQSAIYDYIFDQYPKDLTYYRLGTYLVKELMMDRISQIAPRLTLDELHRLLSVEAPEDTTLLVTLFELGARFIPDSHAYKQTTKFNLLLTHYRSQGGK